MKYFTKAVHRCTVFQKAVYTVIYGTASFLSLRVSAPLEFNKVIQF
jgi:hypothetical protein